MRGNFSEIIAASWEWTRTVLFRPFQIKKWLILGFIALLAGQLSYGYNSRGNVNLPRGDSRETKVEETSQGKRSRQEEKISSRAEESSPFQKSRASFQKIDKRFLASIIAGLIFVFILFFFLFTWIFSRFSFIFIEAVVKNEASIKKPFRENRRLGNSYFLWNITIGIISLTLAGALGLFMYLSLSRIGVFSQGIQAGGMKILLAILPFIVFIGIIGIIFVFLTFVVNNFILPVMYKDKMTILKAWRPVLKILNENKRSVFLYLLIKAGLMIAVFILAGLVGMLVSFSLLLPAGLSAGLIFLGYRSMPVFLHPAYIAILIIIGLPLFLAAGFCLNCIFLPIAVFFQTFTLKFLSRIEGRYDLFEISTNP